MQLFSYLKHEKSRGVTLNFYCKFECKNPYFGHICIGIKVYVVIKISFYLQSEKSLLYDNVKADLEEKIKRLEEDRNNIDISSGNFL